MTTTGGSEEVEPWQAAAPAQEEQAASAGAGADAASQMPIQHEGRRKGVTYLELSYLS